MDLSIGQKHHTLYEEIQSPIREQLLQQLRIKGKVHFVEYELNYILELELLAALPLVLMPFEPLPKNNHKHFETKALCNAFR